MPADGDLSDYFSFLLPPEAFVHYIHEAGRQTGSKPGGLRWTTKTKFQDF